jgi:hypothetical protein
MSLPSKILNINGMAPIRAGLWHKNAWDASRSVSVVAAAGGYHELDIRRYAFGSLKKSDTLFVLGSGSSINNLQREHFREISSNVSVGINAWALHEFVPDAYCFETGKTAAGPAEDTLFISNRLNRPAVIDAAPEFFFLRPTLPATSKNLVQVPDALAKKGKLYGRANLVPTRPRNLLSDVYRLLESIAAGRSPSNVLLDNGASAVRMVMLGFSQGFRKIVLTGIDLDDRPYFWLAPEYETRSAEIERLFPRKSGVQHSTLSTDVRPFATDEVLAAIGDVLASNYGVRLFVATAASSLRTSLPVYRWGC